MNIVNANLEKLARNPPPSFLLDQDYYRNLLLYVRLIAKSQLKLLKTDWILIQKVMAPIYPRLLVEQKPYLDEIQRLHYSVLDKIQAIGFRVKILRPKKDQGMTIM